MTLPTQMTMGLHPKTSQLNSPFRVSLSLESRSSCSIRLLSLSRRLAVGQLKCSGQQEPGSGSLKNALSNIVDKSVEDLLSKDENKELLDKLNKASERVELAREELADIRLQELEAAQMQEYINQLETRASQIAECQNEVSEARRILEEAEQSLSMSTEGNVDSLREEERVESVKAASISALVGTLAAAPVYLSKMDISPQFLFQLGITFANCALFGITFRYAVRRDLDNIQLKTGTAAAFAFVKGLATLSESSPLELTSASLLSHALDGAFFVSQDLLVFIFAAVSLDFCFKTGIVSPFPMNKTE